MKRIFLLAALLVGASACATETTTNTTTPTNTNANTTPSPKAEAAATDADIIAKEKEINEKIKSGDTAGFGAMLTDDFILVGGEGVYDKAGTIDGIKDYRMTEANLTDWKVIWLDKTAAVVTYKAATKGTYQGKPIPDMTSYASSVWVKRGDKWLGLYHQESEVKPAPPPKPAAEKVAAKPEASPAAPAAPVTPDADPIKRENQVWDALKKKDYATFASFLADDQIEVWETGVHDKAGSVEGVKTVNFTGATLSEFKTVKISDNATLITYTAKGPAPAFSKLGDRQTSIWANRNGKWWAVFHQGTAIMPPQAPPK